MCAVNPDSLKLDINGILRRLPHRYPFLLVDRVLEHHAGESIRALKNVTYGELLFAGHSTSRPVMPGVMIIEALAQAAAILCFLSANVIPNDETRFYFVGIDKGRFRKPVEPGDQLILTAQIKRSFKPIWRFSTAAFVGESEVAHAQIVAHAEITAAPETGGRQ